MDVGIDVPETMRHVQPDLGLGRFAVRVTELADERGCVPALPPRLRKARADGTRRSPDLIRERVALLSGKSLADLMDLDGRLEPVLVDHQLPEPPDNHRCPLAPRPSPLALYTSSR